MSINTYRNVMEFCREIKSIWNLPKRVSIEGLFYIKQNDVGEKILYYCELERHYIELTFNGYGECIYEKAYYRISERKKSG